MTVYSGKKWSADYATVETTRPAGALIHLVKTPGVTPTAGAILMPKLFGPLPVTLVLDGGGSVIATGFKGFVPIPYAFTITSCEMLSKESTTSVIDIWECTYAEFDMVAHPVDGDSITVGGTAPTITAAFKSQPALTGWTTSHAAGIILAFNLDSNNNSTYLTLQLTIEKV